MKVANKWLSEILCSKYNCVWFSSNMNQGISLFYWQTKPALSWIALTDVTLGGLNSESSPTEG